MPFFGLFGGKRPKREQQLAPARSAGAVDETAAEAAAKRWYKRLKKSAGDDPMRYTDAGLRFAARARLDYDTLVRHADSFGGLDMDNLELEARENIASIASVPDTILSKRTRDKLIESAARGEGSYAYPPLQIGIPRERMRFNIWHRDRRVDVEELEAALGGVIESASPRRIAGPAKGAKRGRK